MRQLRVDWQVFSPGPTRCQPERHELQKKPKKGPQSSTKNLGHVSQRDDGAKKD